MSEWIETSAGNRISKLAEISGPDRIIISGNATIHPGVKIHGDVELLANASNKNPDTATTIQLGKFCYIRSNSQIIPPVLKESKPENKTWHGPISIGAYTIIGNNSIVKSANIGNRVLIEDDCVLENLSIVYDCCLIRRGTVIPPKTVIPPYSEVSGVAGKDFSVRSLNNSYKKLIELEAKELQILGI
ncbi:dynactin subunit P25 [Scheffersomyces xylosifermentans]|uniref:dynactin subunit P25 n=1 Tax=Scheffersomyces xylosifermentans TaxID=1304137 RepID=UPI00315DD05B